MSKVHHARRRCGAIAFAGLLGLALTACGGGGGGMMPPPAVDPVAMALKAPGVRTAIVPTQQQDIAIVVPPCGTPPSATAGTEVPEGSNQVIIPADSEAQSVAVQPCIEGQPQENQGAGTILLSPGGGSTAARESQQQSVGQQNQLVIPENSDLRRVIVPPCIVVMSSSSSSSSSSGATGGTSNTLALPAQAGEDAVAAPPCTVMASSSSSGG